MLLSALSFLVVAQSSSEVPEGLMNNPVLIEFHNLWYDLQLISVVCRKCIGAA